MRNKTAIGIDTGGTFTDLATIDPCSGQVTVTKVPSTPADPAEAIRQLLVDRRGAAEGVVHGTTVATNVVLERKGASVALITTLGFRDSLEIGRTRRGSPGLFNTKFVKHPPLIARSRRFEVDERMLADGTVLRPLDLNGLKAIVEALKAISPQAVVVCLLHSYANDAHERQVRDVLRRELPACPVVLSSEVVPEFREYERLSTAVINAYTLPSMSGYLGRLSGHVESNDVGELFVMGSNGGIMTAASASNFPARTVLSGPAGGVRGATLIAEAAGVRSILTCDMGGTSTDVSLVKDLHPDMVQDTMIAGLPLKLPQFDIQTVGAGGGSIAWIDVDGSLHVGPQSAGAMPGPACYGRGGTAVTVTDANLCLGRLGAKSLIGGALDLDPKLARKALEDLGARAKFDDLDKLAHGVLQLVTANMVGALREISIERGHDPRDFTLLPFGGAGPLHATDIAREMGISRILVPKHSGNLSAIGLLASDIRYDFARTVLALVDDAVTAKLDAILAELESQGMHALERDGFGLDDSRITCSIDMRHRGQAFALSVPIERELPSADALKARFASLYKQRYGVTRADQPVETVAVRISAIGLVRRKVTPRALPASGRASDAIKARRPVYFEGRWIDDCPVYRRDGLGAGCTLSGPAIIEEFGSTTVVPASWKLVVDDWGNLRMEQ